VTKEEEMFRPRIAAALGVGLLVGACGSTAVTSYLTTTATHIAAATSASLATHTTADLRPPAGGRVSAGFVPRSFTAIGDHTWWLLGTAPSCISPPCASTAIVRTTDGGGHFVGIPAPRAPYFFLPQGPPSKYATTAVSELRFADALNGFAYGGGLYVTHNGGSSWNRVSLGGSVTDLAIADGYVYAVVVSSSGHGRLMRSPVGREAWIALPAAGRNASGLSVHGTDVFLGSENGLQLLVSHNRGATFTSYRSPGAGLGCAYEEAQAPVVWARCATGTEAQVFRSTNGGQRFRPAGLGYGQEIPNLAAFAAATGTVAAVADNHIYRTGNGGASWTAKGPSGFLWPYLGFTDATHGAALGVPSSYGGDQLVFLFYTTDGGRSWHKVTIGSQPFPDAPVSQSFRYGSSCPAAPTNPYLTSPAGCLSVREADVDGDGRPDLLLLYTHPGVKRFNYHFTLKVFLASGGIVTVQLSAGDIPASFLLLRNVNGRPGVEMFVHTAHISTSEEAAIYTFNGIALQRAGSFAYDGYDIGEVQFGIVCHVPKTIVQYEFSTNTPGPASGRIWKELATTLSWQGAALKPAATTTATFKGANPPAGLVGVGC
jgi:hypothetical protein